MLPEASFEALAELFRGSDFARIRPHVAHGAVQAEFDYVQQAREEGPNIVQAFHDSMAQRGGRLHDVVEDVCAMANTNGGTIYVGVSPDPKQPPAGVMEVERSVRELQTAIAHQLSPQSACTVDTLTTHGKKIIRITVPRGDDPPYALDDNKIFVREEAESTMAVRDEIVQLVLRGRGQAPAAQPAADP
jgi:predicted HTH transcriptional regulator